MVCDFREVNKHIKKPHFPFPNLQDIKNFIKKESRYFIKLDLSESYHQIRLHRDSRKYTQFLTEFGYFQ